MREKLVFLAFVLTAVAATSTTPPAAADACPKNSHLIVCPDGHSFCCPNNAFCVCFP